MFNLSNLNFNRNQLIAAYSIVALALVGVIVLVAKSGAFHASSEAPKFADVSVTEPSPLPSASQAASTKLCIHVAGKVKKPGVYELDLGKRVVDAIKIAGGACANADIESVNLAEKLADGEQVYIAPKGQIPPPVRSLVRGAPSGTSTASTAKVSAVPAGNREESGPKKLTAPGQGTVNINTAGLADLQRLSGVGPSTAQRILDYRNQNGRFKSVDELDEVKGIGPSKIEKLRPFISL